MPRKREGNSRILVGEFETHVRQIVVERRQSGPDDRHKTGDDLERILFREPYHGETHQKEANQKADGSCENSIDGG
jgi:hypothetical protein